MTLRPCLECGEPAEGSRCDGCAPVAERPRRYPKKSPRARGYDRQWDMLSAQLRRIAVCGTRSGLQGHHLPGAWARVACGLPLRPGVSVDVLCGPCNRAAGPSPTVSNPGEESPSPGVRDPRGQAQFELHSGSPEDGHCAFPLGDCLLDAVPSARRVDPALAFVHDGEQARVVEVIGGVPPEHLRGVASFGGEERELHTRSLPWERDRRERSRSRRWRLLDGRAGTRSRRATATRTTRRGRSPGRGCNPPRWVGRTARDQTPAESRGEPEHDEHQEQAWPGHDSFEQLGHLTRTARLGR